MDAGYKLVLPEQAEVFTPSVLGGIRVHQMVNVAELSAAFVELVPGQHIPPHSHNTWELITSDSCSKGPVYISTRPNVWDKLSPGEYIFIDAGTPHLVSCGNYAGALLHRIFPASAEEAGYIPADFPNEPIWTIEQRDAEIDCSAAGLTIHRHSDSEPVLETGVDVDMVGFVDRPGQVSAGTIDYQPGQCLALHTHRRWELIIVDFGSMASGFVKTSGSWWDIIPGGYTYLPVGCEHGWSCGNYGSFLMRWYYGGSREEAGRDFVGNPKSFSSIDRRQQELADRPNN